MAFTMTKKKKLDELIILRKTNTTCIKFQERHQSSRKTSIIQERHQSSIARKFKLDKQENDDKNVTKEFM